MNTDNFGINGIIESGSLKIDNKLGELLLLAGAAYFICKAGMFLHDKVKVDAKVDANFNMNCSPAAKDALKDFM